MPRRRLFASFACSLIAVAAIAQPQPAAPAKPATSAQPAADAPKPDFRRYGAAAPTRKPEGAIRLAAYNLENFFEKHGPAKGKVDESAQPPKPESQRKAISDVIHAINADVLCVEEVESLETLTHFRDQYLTDLNYTYVVSLDAGDERGIEQGVLSRFPITDARQWLHAPLGGVHPDKAGRSANPNAGKPIEFHRTPLRVTLTIGGIAPAVTPNPEKPTVTPAFSPQPTYTLTLFVVHQKSGKDWEYWREKEAARTAELVAELQKEDPNRNIAIVGDFNAAPGASSLKIYTDAGLIDAFGDVGGKDKSFITHASGKSLDHILFNAAASHEFLKDSRFVLGTPALPADADWRTTPPPDGYASDHYPVVVDLIATDR